MMRKAVMNKALYRCCQVGWLVDENNKSNHKEVADDENTFMHGVVADYHQDSC